MSWMLNTCMKYLSTLLKFIYYEKAKLGGEQTWMKLIMCSSDSRFTNLKFRIYKFFFRISFFQRSTVIICGKVWWEHLINRVLKWCLFQEYLWNQFTLGIYSIGHLRLTVVNKTRTKKCIHSIKLQLEVSSFFALILWMHS